MNFNLIERFAVSFWQLAGFLTGQFTGNAVFCQPPDANRQRLLIWQLAIGAWHNA
jgi:hypothetical protein